MCVNTYIMYIIQLDINTTDTWLPSPSFKLLTFHNHFSTVFLNVLLPRTLIFEVINLSLATIFCSIFTHSILKNVDLSLSCSLTFTRNYLEYQLLLFPTNMYWYLFNVVIFERRYYFVPNIFFAIGFPLLHMH